MIPVKWIHRPSKPQARYPTNQSSTPLQPSPLPSSRLLLDEGADLNEWFERGEVVGGPGTALHVATEKGRLGTVKWLLRHGADKGLRTIEGKTARDVCPRDGYGQLKELLA
ncbi:uncharacterized protein EI97DRAFT_433033 [Westerdykella ornata]|uniref:Uncharacterized protein n=1 Tax=Westerdykella ornata TaxID=318751 RepID=A0A6A6JK06_WESOR|nr:uncharacterized protein EI97DRAFT_433033 [Westerdykella ornata]KAF2276802.1 hypothetical protein EI97DRAFT_433033 [Westerdykella ornata]